MDHVKQALIRTANILYKLDQLPALMIVERDHETFLLRYMAITGYEEVEMSACDARYKEGEIFAMLGRLKEANLL